MRFELAPNLDILAPGLITQDWNETFAFGAATWLLMNSKNHRNAPLLALSSLVLPAIRLRQFVLAFDPQGKPVFYISWANFNLEAEIHYLTHSPLEMPLEYWDVGDRTWVLDWIAPFGHSRVMKNLLFKQLLANRWGYALDHRGNERGPRVKTFRGAAVLPEEIPEWPHTEFRLKP